MTDQNKMSAARRIHETQPRFVQRDQAGKVVGHFSVPQSYAQEMVEHDHPDILAFKAERKAAEEAALAGSPKAKIAALEARLAELEARLATKP